MSPEKSNSRVIFLDRDGVINFDSGKGTYITSHDKFKFIPGSREAIKMLTDEGYRIIIISNQAGVAKGLYSHQDLDKITDKLIKGVEELGGKIHSINYCMHQDEDFCECRKPKPGNIIRASVGLNYNPTETFIIGDSRRDILAGKALRLKTIFVASGNTKLQDLDVKPNYIAKNLLNAVEKIVLVK